eukprot:15303-Eustigmatos_ZCMA.PRE.1
MNLAAPRRSRKIPTAHAVREGASPAQHWTWPSWRPGPRGRPLVGDHVHLTGIFPAHGAASKGRVETMSEM